MEYCSSNNNSGESAKCMNVFGMLTQKAALNALVSFDKSGFKALHLWERG